MLCQNCVKKLCTYSTFFFPLLVFKIKEICECIDQCLNKYSISNFYVYSVFFFFSFLVMWSPWPCNEFMNWSMHNLSFTNVWSRLTLVIYKFLSEGRLTDQYNLFLAMWESQLRHWIQGVHHCRKIVYVAVSDVLKSIEI